jgi:O-antigen ligase
MATADIQGPDSMSSILSPVRWRVARLTPAERVLPVGFVVYSLGVVCLYGTGRIDMFRAAGMLLAPWVLLLSLFRPAWLIVLLIATPPGLLAFASPTLLSVPLLVALAGLTVLRGRTVEVRSGVLPLATLVLLAFLFEADVGPVAHLAAHELKTSLIYYTLLLLVSYHAVRTGELGIDALIKAILIGAVGTVAIFIAQSGLNPRALIVSSEAAPAHPGLLFHRTHFGYFVVIPFCIGFAGLVLSRTSRGPRTSLWNTVWTLVFLSVAGLSFTRGAWLSALLTVLLVGWMLRKRRYWLLVPLMAFVLIVIPLTRERLQSDISGGLGTAIATGELGTNRLELWRELWSEAGSNMPWGGGFGFAFSLSPQRLFGEQSFVTGDNPLVYPHNDFLYWTLEFGIIGLVLWVSLWLLIIRAFRAVIRAQPPLNHSGYLLTGVLITFMVASLVDNLLFIRPLAERFFVVAGMILAFGALARERSTSISRPSSATIGERTLTP